ncbi:MAG: hypothetical protein V1770_01035 [bacterium]
MKYEEEVSWGKLSSLTTKLMEKKGYTENPFMFKPDDGFALLVFTLPRDFIAVYRIFPGKKNVAKQIKHIKVLPANGRKPNLNSISFLYRLPCSKNKVVMIKVSNGIDVLIKISGKKISIVYPLSRQ